MATPIKPSDLFSLITENDKSVVDGLIEFFNDKLRSHEYLFSVTYKVLLSEHPARTSNHIRYVVQLFKEQGWEIDESGYVSDMLITFSLPKRS